MAISFESEEPKPTTLDQMDEILGLMEVTDDTQIPPNIGGNLEQVGPSNGEAERPEPEGSGHIQMVQYPSNIGSNQQLSPSVHKAQNLVDALAGPQGQFNQTTSQNCEIEGHQGALNINLTPQQSLYDRHIQYQSTIQLKPPRSVHDRSTSHHPKVHCSQGTGDMQEPSSINPILLHSLYDQHTKYPLNAQAHPSRGLYDRRVPGLERANLVPPRNVQWDAASLPPSGSESRLV